MRFAALCLTSVFIATLAGCAGSEPEGTDSADSNLSGTGTCRVMHEDSEVVVLRTQDGKMMYAGKQLHVIDVRVSPRSTNPAFRGTRFGTGHIQYTVAPRVRPDALRRLGQLVGPGTPMAAMALDPATASVGTAILPASSSATANADGSASVELNDAPTDGASPFMDSALRKQLVTGAKANATITCGTNSIPLAINTTGNVIFDTTTAKVLEPAVDLAAVEALLGTASSIRADAYKDPLAQVNSADLNARMAAFADIVDREINPIVASYGAGMSRADLKTHLRNAYDAYRELNTAVVDIAKDETIVQQLVPAADDIKTKVEKALNDNGDGWVAKPLQ